MVLIKVWAFDKNEPYNKWMVWQEQSLLSHDMKTVYF
jgi:hypothetical protein